MAEGLNRVMLLGNLGQDPELKITQGGQAILKIRMATTESYLDRNNTRQERTEWHSVSVWGKRGESLAKFLSKGSRVFVEGSIRTSSYEKNGEKRYSTEINALNIVLCGGGASDGAGEQRSFGGGQQQQRGGGGGGGRPYGGAPTPKESRDEAGFDDFAGDASDDEIPFAMNMTLRRSVRP